MTGIEVLILIFGVLTLLFSFFRKPPDKKAMEENVWRKTDIPWFHLALMLLQLPIWAFMFAHLGSANEVSAWVLTGMLLVTAGYGVSMGRSVEWVRQSGRPAPDSEKANELSGLGEATNPEPS